MSAYSISNPRLGGQKLIYLISVSDFIQSFPAEKACTSLKWWGQYLISDENMTRCCYKEISLANSTGSNVLPTYCMQQKPSTVFFISFMCSSLKGVHITAKCHSTVIVCFQRTSNSYFTCFHFVLKQQTWL